jgi:hypothetical protein
MAIFYEKPEVKFVHRDKPANLTRVGRMIMRDCPRQLRSRLPASLWLQEITHDG